MADDDFYQMATGKLNAQKAFMAGKLKVKGNMGLAMKLNTVISAAQKMAPASSPAKAAAPKSNLKSAVIFDEMKAGVGEKGPALVKKVKGVIQFNVTPGGAWVVDLKNGNGRYVFSHNEVPFILCIMC